MEINCRQQAGRWITVTEQIQMLPNLTLYKKGKLTDLEGREEKRSRT